ncbi:MAG TPA: MFS transporter, partial [Micromonosporaceae bacterium]|nr:MFS transporter [Micromonosporaceae bacterium]
PGRSGPRPRVDVLGGLLLAAGLGLLVVGLYNPDPARAVLPSWGPRAIGLGGLLLVAFLIWEGYAPSRLLDLRGVRKRTLFAALGASALAGAALLVTLVDVQLMAQTLWDKSAMGGALVLARFLVALAAGAALGGLLVPRVGERLVTIFGLVLAGVGYLLIASWPADVLASRYFGVPRLDADLALAGLGLGVVVAPLSASVLRAVPAAQHGVASAAVVVARMMGMLLGVAALSAWGLHRFQSLTATLVTPIPLGIDDAEFQRRVAAYRAALHAALRVEYREIFLVTAALCGLGALCGLALYGRRGRAATGTLRP